MSGHAKFFSWVDPTIVPKSRGSLMHHMDTWCLANDEGKILIYRDDMVQGNSNREISEQLSHMQMYKDLGVTQVIYCENLFLVPSPARERANNEYGY